MISDSETGGPAFPFTVDDDKKEHTSVEWGMTLRDYFAAKALQGQIAHEGMEGCNPSEIAEMAYQLADKMIALRDE